VLYEAIRTFGQGRVQLLDDEVRIVRGREISTFRFQGVAGVWIRSPRATQNGAITFERPHGSPVVGNHDPTVNFHWR
jgi:hypothetical protein